MPTLTFDQAAYRFAEYLPPDPDDGSDHPERVALADADYDTRQDAIDLGIEVTGWSGTILCRPFTDVQPGAIVSGQTVLEYDNGVQTDRYVTTRTMRGGVVWCAMVPGLSIGSQEPAGTFSSENLALDACQGHAADLPLDFTLGDDGVFRAGDTRGGRFTVFPSLVDAR